MPKNSATTPIRVSTLPPVNHAHTGLTRRAGTAGADTAGACAYASGVGTAVEGTRGATAMTSGAGITYSGIAVATSTALAALSGDTSGAMCRCVRSSAAMRASSLAMRSINVASRAAVAATGVARRRIGLAMGIARPLPEEHRAGEEANEPADDRAPLPPHRVARQRTDEQTDQCGHGRAASRAAVICARPAVRGRPLPAVPARSRRAVSAARPSTRCAKTRRATGASRGRGATG